MAKMISLIKFSGGLDDMIGYRVKGQIRLRRKPDKVKQTLATKRAAKDFGSASRTSAILRHGMAKEITHYHDDSFLNRLNTAMIGVVKSDIVRPAGRRQVTIGNLHALEGFQINQYRGIQCGYTVQRLHDGSLQVTVHQPLDQFHHQVHDLQFRAIAVFPDFQGGNTAVASSETVLLNDVQAKGITAFCLTIPATHAGAAVVILETTSCIIEHGKPLPMRNRKHNAADIIAVVPPVKEQGTATSWPPAEDTALHTAIPATPAKGANPG